MTSTLSIADISGRTSLGPRAFAAGPLHCQLGADDLTVVGVLCAAVDPQAAAATSLDARTRSRG
jgi:hypothetical protein